MDQQRTASLRRRLAWMVGPCLPPWLVLLALAAFQRLAWLDAAIAALAIFVVMAIAVIRRIGDFDRLTLYAESLLDNPDASPPALNDSATASRLLGAIIAVKRLWADRRAQAEGLARSRQSIIDGVPEPLLLLDRERRVRGANAMARELFEVGTVSLLGDNGGRFVADRDLASVIRDPKVLEAVDTVIATGRHAETSLVLPSPVSRTYRMMVVPLGGTVDHEPSIIIALHDQTEALKIERMRADFVANASHELRTPLSAVLGFIETLRGPAKDDEKARAEFLEIMFKQASRMARLIDDLLSLSRIELREHTRPADAVDVSNAIRTTVELAQAEANRRRMRVVVTTPPDLPPAIGDAGELSQVFANLLTNAIKYGGEDSRIEITAEVAPERPSMMAGSGPCLKVAVRDYGEGISRDHLPRLTERFYRVDTARSRALGGTGLGLAIVKHITNRHRGALTIDSTEGAGSTFTVWLPMAPPDVKP
jgi:two-component system phosphate regulon sensor histidine kinase PhoR